MFTETEVWKAFPLVRRLPAPDNTLMPYSGFEATWLPRTTLLPPEFKPMPADLQGPF